MDKKLLKAYGESTAYTAKGHFKAADIRRRLNLVLIVLIMAISVLSISQLIQSVLVAQIMGVCSLLASIFLLIFEFHDGHDTHIRHRLYADKYLELHYDIFHAFESDECTQEEIKKLKNRMNKLNRKERPTISSFARKSAKKAIEVKKEMIVWWE